MKKYILKLVLLFSILIINSNFLFSQDKKEAEKTKADPSVEFIYQKNSDESYTLTCNIGISINRDIRPLKNTVLNFSCGNDFEISLGSAVTNKRGKAVCNIPKNFTIPVNSDGKFSFKVEFSGNDTANSAEEQLQFKDLKMEMNCEIQDSVKKVSITAYTLQANGNKMPLRNETVIFYIPRMFSMQKIGEAKTDTFGIAAIDFPPDLPGDTAGRLKIVARLEDHSDFGNVEKYEIKNWGKKSSSKFLFTHRALWTAVAPVWMIVTLTIMLVGVWAHYLYVIVRLWMLSKAGKKPEDYRIY